MTELATQQCFHLCPHSRITFDLNVRFREEASTPGEITAFDRSLLILLAKIVEDCRVRWVGRDESLTGRE
jgi:hypothetical protein